MKIQILSDLHQEFGLSEISFDKADIVIIAGDINIGVKGIIWILKNILNMPVIYILGNHEYYKGSYPKTLNKIKDLSYGTNVNVLENNSIVIGDVTFHGTTLWTNFEIIGNPRQYGGICQEKMSDYKLIRKDPSYSRLRSIDVYNIHNQSIKWLETSLISSTTKTNVVITHHAPSIKSVPAKYKDDYITAAYASNLDSFILKYQPNYWIHGHIHEPIEYKIGETKVICNPHGYIDEPYNGFDKEKIIEI